AALGGHLARHRLLDLARRRDLTNLDRRDLDAPAIGHLIELAAQRGVDVLAAREHLVEQHVADHRTQSGNRDAARGALILLDVDDARDGVDDLGVDEEVDGDGGIVLRDTGLRRHVEDALAQVHADAFVDEREEQYQTRPTRANQAAEAQYYQPLVL